MGAGALGIGRAADGHARGVAAAGARDRGGERRVPRAADILGLGVLLDRFPRQLSGGQRQRVAMGRAIVRDPQVFLFDEPLSNLDAQLREEMRAELKRLQRQIGITTILSAMVMASTWSCVT